MRIGIDIDDVITDTYLSLKQRIEKYDTTGEVAKNIVDVMRGDVSNPIVKEFGMLHYVPTFKEVYLKPNASEVIQRLFDSGNEIYIITSRGESKEYFRGAEDVTLNYLKSNKIKYTKIIFNASNKAKICKENNIDVLIDDSIKHCEETAKEHIKSIVFTSEVNKNLPTHIKRADNWLELEKIISDIKKNKI